MTREVLSVGALAVLAVVVLLLMRKGWRGRAERSAVLVGDLPVAPADPGPVLHGPVEATYVSTTLAGSWLDRVVAHDLGSRSPAQVLVLPAGVLLQRTGAADVFVPAADLLGAGLAPAIAGKVVGGEGLVILHWRLGTQEVETGVLPRHRADRPALVEAVTHLITSTSAPDPTSHATEERT